MPIIPVFPNQQYIPNPHVIPGLNIFPNLMNPRMNIPYVNGTYVNNSYGNNPYNSHYGNEPIHTPLTVPLYPPFIKKYHNHPIRIDRNKINYYFLYYLLLQHYNDAKNKDPTLSIEFKTKISEIALKLDASIKLYHYLCILTENKPIDIHHLLSFNIKDYKLLTSNSIELNDIYQKLSNVLTEIDKLIKQHVRILTTTKNSSGYKIYIQVINGLKKKGKSPLDISSYFNCIIEQIVTNIKNDTIRPLQPLHVFYKSISTEIDKNENDLINNVDFCTQNSTMVTDIKTLI
jgi:hypothetical protein